MKTLTIFLAALFVLTLGLAVQGCSKLTGSEAAGVGPDDDSLFEDTALDLNAEHGGYDFENEPPGFGDTAFDQFTEDPPADDPWAEDPAVEEMLAEAEDVYYAYLRWGQLRFNPNIQEATDWSGSISVDTGAIVVLRLIRFEPEDWIEERPLATQVDLVSTTTVSFDGLLLQIIDDEPGETDNTLHVQLGSLSYSMPVASLDGYHEVVDVDELGNQFSIHALHHLDCPNGFMQGIWVGSGSSRGVLRGGWYSWEGDLLGHYRGHWGITEAGDSLFRGKLIDLDGNFWAMLRGRWVAHDQRHGDGDYHGYWLSPTAESIPMEIEVKGPLWGFYKTGFDAAGHMAGRWMEWCE